jgi:hypothetical protein
VDTNDLFDVFDYAAKETHQDPTRIAELSKRLGEIQKEIQKQSAS